MCGNLGACASGGPYVENGPHGSTKPLRFRLGRRGIGRRAPREAAFVNALRAILEWVRESPVRAILVAVLIVLLVVFMGVGLSDPASAWSAWVYRFFGVKEGTENFRIKFQILEFIGVGMGGVLLAIGATIAHRRARAMEDAANAQAKAADAQAKAVAQQTVANQGAEDGRRQERLKNAIKHLGDKSASVRLGGAYELFHLAQDTREARDTKDLGQTVMDILCAHIRQTTSDEDYQEDYRSKPSTEIQSLLSLLFVQEHEVFRGCEIHLRDSWLNGAFLRSARLQGAPLTGAWLQGAFVSEAYLQGADLYGAHMREVELYEARLQGANLYDVQLQGADLRRAQLQGADLHGAQLQGADLRGAQLQGATSERADKLPFVERIRQNTDQGSDLSKATLEPHIGRSESHELLQRRGAIVGAYTEEEADQWIAEYNEATGKG